jgi:hypothetical protein
MTTKLYESGLNVKSSVPWSLGPMAKGGVVPSASHLTENVPGPARKDSFRLIDAHMKCLRPSECGT